MANEAAIKHLRECIEHNKDLALAKDAVSSAYLDKIEECQTEERALYAENQELEKTIELLGEAAPAAGVVMNFTSGSPISESDEDAIFLRLPRGRVYRNSLLLWLKDEHKKHLRARDMSIVDMIDELMCAVERAL